MRGRAPGQLAKGAGKERALARQAVDGVEAHHLAFRTDQADFRLPLTQTELGDATGLSSVHVNRTMQELRRMGLILSRGNVHSILDWDQLQMTADFSPEYLYMKAEPR